jgi:hypothetical protein
MTAAVEEDLTEQRPDLVEHENEVALLDDLVWLRQRIHARNA